MNDANTRTPPEGGAPSLSVVLDGEQRDYLEPLSRTDRPVHIAHRAVRLDGLAIVERTL
jgi:hypothetical protein